MGGSLEQVEQATQGAEVVELAGKMRLQLISFGLSRLGGATGCSGQVLFAEIRRWVSTAAVGHGQLPRLRRARQNGPASCARAL